MKTEKKKQGIDHKKSSVWKKKRKRIVLAGMLPLLLAAAFCVFWGLNQNVRAAEGFGFTIGGTENPIVTEYTMEENSVMAYLSDADGIYDDPKRYVIEWVASEKDVIDFKPEKSSSGQEIRGKIIAKASGSSNLTVSVRRVDGGDIVGQFSCKIKVGFSIATASYEYVNKNDAKKSIVLNHSGDTKNVKLLFDAPGAVWKIDNLDVAGISATAAGTPGKQVETQRTSGDGSIYIQPKNTGKTRLTVSYVDSLGTDHGSSFIDVYVRPAVAYTAPGDTTKPSSFDASDNINNWPTLDTDSYIYVDTEFSDNPNEELKQKVSWVILYSKELNLDPVFLKDSLGNKGNFTEKELNTINLVEDDSKAGRYKLHGKAGKYRILFFTAGSYTEPYNTEPGYYNACKPITIEIKIYADLKDGNFESMIVGESIDLEEYYNLTPAFVKDYLTVVSSNAGIVNVESTSEKAQLTAEDLGTATITINVNGTALDDFIKPPKKSQYTITVNVISGFRLNVTEDTIYVGSTLNLRVDNTAFEKATYEWEVSDKKYLSIDSTENTAKVTALAPTPSGEKVTVKVTCTLPGGIKRIATCSLTIRNSIDSIKMIPDQTSIMEDEVKVIKTDASGSTPFKWSSSDEKVVTVEPLDGNAAATITGIKSGEAVITVTNPQNYVQATCKVTVLGEVTDIKFEQGTSLKVPLSQKTFQFTVITTPSTVTGLNLVWQSEDESVAKVSQEGVVTLLKGGKTTITARPKSNPLMKAYCDLTVEENSTGFKFNSESVTVEAGKKVKLEYTLTPEDAKTTINWRVLDSKYASVSDDGEVTGVSGGQTYIVASTSEGFTDVCKVTVTQTATNVTLSTYDINIAVGETYQVEAKAVPATSTESRFTWTSKDAGIASVTSDGKVTGVSAGSTIILVKTTSGKVEYLYVTVRDDLTGMTLTPTSKTITKDKTFTLKPVFSPATATNKSVTYKSTDPSVATVNASGLVKGVGGGMAVITCESKDGGFLAFCVVTVEEKATGIKLNKSSAKLGIGKTLTLKATVTSNTATNQKLKWKSSNSRVASVNQSGKVTAKKVGKATITCSATDGSGSKATCTITVVRSVSKVTLNKTTIRMLEGRTTKIKAAITPSNATTKGVTWKTTDENVANIDTSGNIMALAEGKCQITATARDGSGKSASCWVYVTKAVPATGITISSKNMVLVKGSSEQISATIQPSNTTDGLKYFSDSKSIASVSSKGRVTARKPGVATITVTATSGAQTTVSVTVVGLNKTSITKRQYETETIWVEEVSSNVRWQSEDASIATVDQNGKIICRKPGTTYVMATVRGIKLRCKVTVTRLR